MRVAFLGATRGMGRALARLMAERGHALFLLGRDAADLEKSARDLEARSGRGPVRSAPCDLSRPDGFAVRGTGELRGGRLDARGDHRLAMLGAIAGLASRDRKSVV